MLAPGTDKGANMVDEYQYRDILRACGLRCLHEFEQGLRGNGDIAANVPSPYRLVKAQLKKPGARFLP